MSYSNVLNYFKNAGLEDRIMLFDKSSATVAEAAIAVGCNEGQIAKTLSFLLEGEKPILIVAAGDMKINNKKYKEFFKNKAKMLPYDMVEKYTGYAPGGVCPFACKSSLDIYLDVSLKRFNRVYPAAGNDHSAINLTIEELEEHSNFTAWIDVCKNICAAAV